MSFPLLSIPANRLFLFNELLDRLGLTAEVAHECLQNEDIAKARVAAFMGLPAGEALPVPESPKMWFRVNATTIRVNLDHAPTLPFDGAKRAWRRGKKGWVTVELKDGELYVDGKIVVLHREPEQQSGNSIQGHELRKRLARKQVLHPNVMDAIVEAEMVPESWKVDAAGNTLFIYFWAQGFRGSGGNLYVRFVCWSGGRWQRGCRNLDDHWHVGSPTAVAS